MDTLKEYVTKFDVMNSLLGDFMHSNELGGNLALSILHALRDGKKMG